MLLRVRQDEKSRVKNDADLLLRMRQDKMSRVKNNADLLLKVEWEEKSKEWWRYVAKGKTRGEK